MTNSGNLSKNNPRYARIAIPAPLYQVFDYRIPSAMLDQTLIPGIRIQVPFGRQERIGILLEQVETPNYDPRKIKTIKRCLDQTPIFDASMLQLLNWASSYYQYPIGEVTHAALPSLLRKGHEAKIKLEKMWRLSELGNSLQFSILNKAPKQLALFHYLLKNSAGLTKSQLATFDENWSYSIRALIKKLIVEECSYDPHSCIDEVGINEGDIHEDKNEHKAECDKNSTTKLSPALKLNPEQSVAFAKIMKKLNCFTTFLLFGDTGSGKTEVYLQTINALIKQNKQVLILVPEIGLTPQLIDRFKSRFGNTLTVNHSKLNDSERLTAWVLANSNKVKVILGTRSAVFMPCPNLGAIIIDEEHDLSFKQQDGFRYSARDVAIRRAQLLNIPIILGSATPSLESMQNCINQKFELLRMTKRAGQAQKPKIHLIDIRAIKLNQGLSDTLITEIKNTIAQNKQVLLFLNRRGFAPTLLCHDCGWTAQCLRCDARLTYHAKHSLLRCHHCGSEQKLIKQCLQCNSQDLHHYGQGTEQIETALKQLLPDANISRIDRDTTRRKGSLDKALAAIHSGESQILIGTQMLAKGHHFPNVALVGVIDSDQGLHGTDFRASERLSQLILQVAGRAGRAETPGQVLIQTHHPHHPLMQLIVKQDYQQIADNLLAERKETLFPPFSYLAILRAEANDADAALNYLNDVANLATNQAQVSLLGPMPAPMERRAGRYRAQLIINANQRKQIHEWAQANLPLISQSKLVRRVRWSLDIDPQEVL